MNCMLKVEPLSDLSKGTVQGLFTVKSSHGAPSVISTSPSDNAVGVATDGTIISIEFSEDMNPASVNESTFKVNNGSSDIDGAVKYDNETRTATFTPAEYLDYETEYTVTITSGVRDTDGNALPSDYTWSFTIESIPEHPGYAIIIQGKTSSGEGLKDHNRTTRFVYDTLRDRGLGAENIRYFNYDTGQGGVYSIPRKDEISTTITGWAKEQMDEGPADLYIIMVNHGSKGRFYIHDSDPIVPSDIAEWLDTLQNGLREDVHNQNKIIAILGFCYSGSFIPELSGTNRVIISSTAADELSYRGGADENGILEGAYFVAEFFRSVAFGKSVKECFEEAVASTETYTADLNAVSGRPYYDHALQHPLLDDNGDGKGSNDFSSWSGDGWLSENIKSVGIGRAWADENVTDRLANSDPVFIPPIFFNLKISQL